MGPRSSIYIETDPVWLYLPLSGTNFHGPKPVRATEDLLVSFFPLNLFVILLSLTDMPLYKAAIGTRLDGYKNNVMLNSGEHEFFPVHKC